MHPPPSWRRLWPQLVAACLHLTAVRVAAARSPPDVSISKIYIDPAAERVFPNAQSSAPCAIITIDGLGPLDSDYTLIDDPAGMAQRRPTWIGTSNTQHLALSYQPADGLWTIGGVDGLTAAYVKVDSSLPPAHSSLWRVFREHPARFERVDNIVIISCPGTDAFFLLYVSTLGFICAIDA